MRLRQLVLVAADLAPLERALESVFGLGEPYRDPGVGSFGLHNVVYAVGDTFLEVVSPERAGTTAGRYLERRNGDGGYMVILQVDDITTTRAHLSKLGVRVVWQHDLEDIFGTHLHPKDHGGAILSIDQALPPSSWRWAGPGWEARRGAAWCHELLGCEIQSGEPDRIAARWSEILDWPLSSASAVPELRFDQGFVRFVRAADDRGEGVSAFHVAVGEIGPVLRAARDLGLEVSAAGERRHSLPLGGVRFELWEVEPGQR